MTVVETGDTWVHVLVDAPNSSEQIARAVFAVERGSGSVVVGTAPGETYPANLDRPRHVTVAGLHTGSTYDLWTVEVLPWGYESLLGPITAVIGGPAATAPTAPDMWWWRMGDGINVKWHSGFDGGSPIVAWSVVATDAAGAVIWWENEPADVHAAGLDQLDVSRVAMVSVYGWNSRGIGAPATFTPPAGIGNQTQATGPRYGYSRGREGLMDVVWGPTDDTAGHHVIAYSVAFRNLQTDVIVKWVNFGPNVRSATIPVPADCTAYVLQTYAWTAQGISLQGPGYADFARSDPRDANGIPIACH